MREIWVLDSETDPFKKGRVPEPFLWIVYTGKQYYQFTKTNELINFLKNQDVIIYAHNGGKFDYHFLINELAPFTDIMIINGRLSKFKIGECEFRDSYNILPIPLKTYKKDDIDYNLMERTERNKPENWDKIVEYCKADCKYLHELISAFITEYGFNLTLATSALKTWEKIEGMTAPRTSGDFYKTIKPFYYGGRVECFKTGILKNNYILVDINSAYPFAMQHEHPFGDDIAYSNKLPKTEKQIQRAFIKLDCKSTGVFPYRTKIALEFPNDNKMRTFFVTGWEYLTAKKLNKLHDVKIHEVLTLGETINFKKYTDHFFKMKAEAKKSKDSAQYIFSKLFLNSLYGKYGANAEKYDEYKILPQQFIEASAKDGYQYNGELGKWALMSRPLSIDKQRYYNVAVSASITGFVRAYLLDALHRVNNPVYCDTDSIFCKKINNLNIGTEIGQWNIEAKLSEGAIAGKKLYAFKIKGTNEYKKATKGTKLTASQVYAVARGNEITYEPENPTFSLTRGIEFVNRKVRKTK